VSRQHLEEIETLKLAQSDSLLYRRVFELVPDHINRQVVLTWMIRCKSRVDGSIRASKGIKAK